MRSTEYLLVFSILVGPCGGSGRSVINVVIIIKTYKTKEKGVNIKYTQHTPQPLYNTIVGVQDNFRVSYPICVVTRVKCIDT